MNKICKKTFIFVMVILIAMVSVIKITPSMAATKTKVKNTKIKNIKVSKVTLNKSSVTAYTGTKVNLAAKVTPTKATNKKVKWSSSNKKSATVDSKGRVTLKSAGTVKITAKAADGSGKYAICKIKILTANAIKSISTIDYQTLKVVMTTSQKLNVNNFVVMVKSSKYAKYIDKQKIVSFSTNDNKTYYIRLGKAMKNSEYVRITGAGLTGVEGKCNKETVVTIYNPDVVKTSFFGYCSTTSSYNEFTVVPKILKGNYACTVSKLPKWIKLRLYGNSYVLEVDNSKPVMAQFVITFTNDYGKKELMNTTICVYDQSKVYAYVSEKYVVTDKNEVKIGQFINSKGGSGSHTYEFASENYGLKLSRTGYISGTLNKFGDTTVKIKVSDKADPSKYCYINYKIHMKKGVRVSGKIINAVEGYEGESVVTFINRDMAKEGFDTEYSYVSSSKEYEVVVAPGKYTVEVGAPNSPYKQYYEIVVPKDGLVKNFAIDYCKVLFDFGDEKYSQIVSWEDNEGIVYGKYTELYLRPGKYELRAKAERDSDGKTVFLCVNINIPNLGTGSVTVKPTQVQVVG